MFYQRYLVAFLTIALPTLVGAVPASPLPPTDQCNLSNQMCCGTVTDSKDPRAQKIFKEHNIQEPALRTTVGLACSGGGLVGITGAGCSSQPVCCYGNYFGGLIGIGCTPITL